MGRVKGMSFRRTLWSRNVSVLERTWVYLYPNKGSSFSVPKVKGEGGVGVGSRGAGLESDWKVEKWRRKRSGTESVDGEGTRREVVEGAGYPRPVYSGESQTEVAVDGEGRCLVRTTD